MGSGKLPRSTTQAANKLQQPYRWEFDAKVVGFGETTTSPISVANDLLAMWERSHYDDIMHSCCWVGERGRASERDEG